MLLAISIDPKTNSSNKGSDIAASTAATARRIILLRLLAPGLLNVRLFAVARIRESPNVRLRWGGLGDIIGMKNE